MTFNDRSSSRRSFSTPGGSCCEARGLIRSHRARVGEATRLIGRSDFADAYPHQLSGGTAQRAALARVLVNDPTLLILGEPLGKLDSLASSRRCSQHGSHSACRRHSMETDNLDDSEPFQSQAAAYAKANQNVRGV
jgi:ABC-type uncharacterized transport system YnjBCD ATPase subunit